MALKINNMQSFYDVIAYIYNVELISIYMLSVLKN